MDHEEYRASFQGVYESDARFNALVDRLQKYYDDTPLSMGNREARVHWRRFNEFCEAGGYTREEISRAKRFKSYDSK